MKVTQFCMNVQNELNCRQYCVDNVRGEEMQDEVENTRKKNDIHQYELNGFIFCFKYYYYN